MLGLAQHIGSHPRGVAAAVRQHQNFRRSCDHINAHLAEHLALGGGNVNVAGTHNFIHGRHALGAVGKGGNRLCAAAFKDAVNARNDRRRQNVGVHLAVPPGGGHHHDLLHPGNLGGDNIHQNGGRVRRCAARHIHARALDGGVFLSQHNAGTVGHNKIFVQLLLVEMPDILRRHF